jgi:hypothetical protein
VSSPQDVVAVTAVSIPTGLPKLKDVVAVVTRQRCRNTPPVMPIVI